MDRVEVILDSDFNVVTLKGREAVDADPVGNELPWYPKAASGNVNGKSGKWRGSVNLGPIFLEGDQTMQM